jgi:hypothetical protein
MKEKTDIRYKKVWKRKQELVNEEKMKEGHPKVRLPGLAIVRDQEKYKGNVKYMNILRRNGKQKEKVNKDQVPEIIGFAVIQEIK